MNTAWTELVRKQTRAMTPLERTVWNSHSDEAAEELAALRARSAQLEAALGESNYLLKSIQNLPNDAFGWIAGRVEQQTIRNDTLLAKGAK
jgi:hypothetical protein